MLNGCPFLLLPGDLSSCNLGAVTFALVTCRQDVCAKQGAVRSECSAFTYAAESCANDGFDTGNWRGGICGKLNIGPGLAASIRDAIMLMSSHNKLRGSHSLAHPLLKDTYDKKKVLMNCR